MLRAVSQQTAEKYAPSSRLVALCAMVVLLAMDHGCSIVRRSSSGFVELVPCPTVKSRMSG